jgi:hypothetical protein
MGGGCLPNLVQEREHYGIFYIVVNDRDAEALAPTMTRNGITEQGRT